MRSKFLHFGGGCAAGQMHATRGATELGRRHRQKASDQHLGLFIGIGNTLSECGRKNIKEGHFNNIA